MLLDEYVTVKWEHGNRKRLESKGYIFTNYKDDVLIKCKDLTRRSNVVVNVKCDICGKEYKTEYGRYLKSLEKGGFNVCYNCNTKKGHILRKKERINKIIKELQKICDDKGYILLSSIDEINTTIDKVKFLCLNHGEQEMQINRFLKGSECFKCSYEHRKLKQRIQKEELIERIESVNDNKLLNPDEYKGVFVHNLKIQCSCGKIFTTSLGNYKRQNRCNCCSEKESSAEKIIREFLEEKHIEFVQEKRYPDCKDIKPLPFDFYLPLYNLIIEFDGRHHFENVYGEEHLKMTQKHDEIKNEYCKKNNINLLRISYLDGHFINSIIQNKLDEIGKRYSLVS